MQSLVDGPLARIGSFQFFARSPEQTAYLQKVSVELKAEMAQLPVLSPAYGICHGDYHSGNLLLHDDDLAIIDLDFCAYSWRLYDVATYIWLQALDQPDLDKIAHEVTQPLLDGYQIVRRLSETEQRLLPYFVIVRQLWLLGGSGIPRTTRFGVGWLLDDYFDRYIAFIRRWLEQTH
jgi:Ser/Thr protein kinase RdoA (MazF antagonist)